MRPFALDDDRFGGPVVRWSGASGCWLGVHGVPLRSIGTNRQVGPVDGYRLAVIVEDDHFKKPASLVGADVEGVEPR